MKSLRTGLASALLLGAFLLFVPQAQAATPVVLHALGSPDTTLTISPQDHGGKQQMAFDVATSNSEVMAAMEGSSVHLDCEYTTPEQSSNPTLVAMWPKGQTEVRIWDNYGSTQSPDLINPIDPSTAKWDCSLAGPLGNPELQFLSSLQDVSDHQTKVEKLFDRYLRDYMASQWVKYGWLSDDICNGLDSDYRCTTGTANTASQVVNRGVAYRGRRTAYYTDWAYLVGNRVVKYRAAAWDFGVISELIMGDNPFRSPGIARYHSSAAIAASLKKTIKDIPGTVMERVISVGVYSRHNRPHSYRGRHVGLWVKKLNANQYAIYGRFHKTGRCDFVLTIGKRGSGVYEYGVSDGWPNQLDGVSAL